MEAIVLAGGLGTRLQSVVSDVPKPMAPVEGKPFLAYILSYLKKNGITKVILSVGYKYEIIENYFGNQYNEIELVYSVEDEPLGTGGAIKKALGRVSSNEVYIINGDTFFDIDLKALELNGKSQISMALKTMYNFDRYGCVEHDTQGNVTNFKEKSFFEKGDINGGIYLVKRDVLSNFPLKDKFSFESFMEENFQKLKITAEVFEDYFIDIGIPQDYEKFQKDVKGTLA